MLEAVEGRSHHGGRAADVHCEPGADQHQRAPAVRLQPAQALAAVAEADQDTAVVDPAHGADGNAHGAVAVDRDQRGHASVDVARKGRMHGGTVPDGASRRRGRTRERSRAELRIAGRATRIEIERIALCPLRPECSLQEGQRTRGMSGVVRPRCPVAHRPCPTSTNPGAENDCIAAYACTPRRSGPGDGRDALARRGRSVRGSRSIARYRRRRRWSAAKNAPSPPNHFTRRPIATCSRRIERGPDPGTGDITRSASAVRSRDRAGRRRPTRLRAGTPPSSTSSRAPASKPRPRSRSTWPTASERSS